MVTSSEPSRVVLTPLELDVFFIYLIYYKTWENISTWFKKDMGTVYVG